jgi:hypothetical protein
MLAPLASIVALLVQDVWQELHLRAFWQAEHILLLGKVALHVSSVCVLRTLLLLKDFMEMVVREHLSWVEGLPLLIREFIAQDLVSDRLALVPVKDIKN